MTKVSTVEPKQNVKGKKPRARIAAVKHSGEKYKSENEASNQTEYWFQETQRIAHLGTYRLDILKGVWQSTAILNDIFGIDAHYEKNLKGWLEIVHPDQRLEMADYFQKSVLDARLPFDKEYRILRPANQEERWVYGRGELILDTIGNPIAMMGTIQDITKHKKETQELIASEERYRRLFDDSPISLWEEDFSAVQHRLKEFREQGITDFREFLENYPEVVAECAEQVRIVDINKATLKLYKANTKAELLTNLRHIFNDDSYEGFRDELVNIANGVTQFECETVNQTLAGDQLTVRLHWSVAPGFEDTLSKVIVFMVNITERVHAEQALRSQETIETNKALQKARAELEQRVEERTADLARANERLKEEIVYRERTEEALDRERRILRTVIDNIPDQIFARDTNCRFTLNNLSDARAAGVSDPETLLGKSDEDFYPTDLADRYRADDRMVMETGQALIDREEPSLGPNNTRRWLLTTKVPLRDSQGQVIGVVGIARDITRQKRAEEDLQKAHAELESRVAERTAELASANERLQTENVERKRAEDELARQAEELRRRNEELARLYRASGSLITGASLNTQEQAQKIVEVVQQEFGQDNCSLFIAQRDSNELVRQTTVGPYADQVRNAKLTLDGDGVVARAMRAGEPVNVPNVHADPHYLPNWEAAQSELAIPLKIGNNVIGAIDVQSSEKGAFSADDERLMTIFAERAALVLEHSRLNTQTEMRIQQLTALRTVDMAISSSFDISLTLGVLLDQVTGLLGLHAADILIFNPATQTFRLAGERGFRTNMLQHTQPNLGMGYAWRAVSERRMIVISNLQTESASLGGFSGLSGEQFVAYLGIPLIAKGQTRGVLEIFHREPIKLEPEWVGFLELLAGQAAIAIDNIELFNNLQTSNSELSMAYDSTLEGWARALELRDHETEGHTRRTTELTVRLAQAMGVKDDGITHIYRGALLHDIGKMGVPDSIVLKAGPLTDEEWAIMHKHPQYAFDLLSPISYLRQALDIPYCHHEKWDGTGYPRKLKGEQIPLTARIFAVIDVWDALTSDRPYRKAWPKEKALDYIRDQSGSHFDPKVVEIFLKEVEYA